MDGTKTTNSRLRINFSEDFGDNVLTANGNAQLTLDLDNVDVANSNNQFEITSTW